MLIVFGLCFGSFVNALVWRVHKQAEQDDNSSQSSKKPKTNCSYSISRGRSMCVHCKHLLAWYDLLPVVSWVSLKGKCRYCKKPISWQYPVVEILTAVLFVFSYCFWPLPLDSFASWLHFGTWLALLVGFVALIVYDIRWMLLPNRIVFPLYALAAFSVLLEATLTSNFHLLTSSAWGVLVGGGIFYILFQLSEGRWIGGGDVKLGFMLGGIVGGPVQAMLMLFVASLLGTLASLPLLATKRIKRQARIPFGPFLIVATIIVELFGHKLTEWYIQQITG